MIKTATAKEALDRIHWRNVVMRILLAVFTLVSSLTAIAADKVGTAKSKGAIVVRWSVHLRQEPTTAATSLGILKPGLRVNSLGARRSGFLQVETTDRGVGWIWIKAT